MRHLLVAVAARDVGLGGRGVAHSVVERGCDDAPGELRRAGVTRMDGRYTFDRKRDMCPPRYPSRNATKRFPQDPQDAVEPVCSQSWLCSDGVVQPAGLVGTKSYGGSSNSGTTGAASIDAELKTHGNEAIYVNRKPDGDPVYQVGLQCRSRGSLETCSEMGPPRRPILFHVTSRGKSERITDARPISPCRCLPLKRANLVGMYPLDGVAHANPLLSRKGLGALLQ